MRTFSGRPEVFESAVTDAATAVTQALSDQLVRPLLVRCSRQVDHNIDHHKLPATGLIHNGRQVGLLQYLS